MERRNLDAVILLVMNSNSKFKGRKNLRFIKWNFKNKYKKLKDKNLMNLLMNLNSHFLFAVALKKEKQHLLGLVIMYLPNYWNPNNVDLPLIYGH